MVDAETGDRVGAGACAGRRLRAHIDVRSHHRSRRCQVRRARGEIFPSRAAHGDALVRRPQAGTRASALRRHDRGQDRAGIRDGKPHRSRRRFVRRKNHEICQATFADRSRGAAMGQARDQPRRGDRGLSGRGRGRGRFGSCRSMPRRPKWGANSAAGCRRTASRPRSSGGVRNSKPDGKPTDACVRWIDRVANNRMVTFQIGSKTGWQSDAGNECNQSRHCWARPLGQGPHARGVEVAGAPDRIGLQPLAGEARRLRARVGRGGSARSGHHARRSRDRGGHPDRSQ